MSNPNIARDSSTTFKKGQSGNPKGRTPRAWTMTGLIEDALEKKDEDGTPIKVTIAEKLAALARRGDMQAIKEINNRLDGMPTQRTELTGAEGEALRIEIIEENRPE